MKTEHIIKLLTIVYHIITSKPPLLNQNIQRFLNSNAKFFCFKDLKSSSTFTAVIFALVL
jgi:hypothetical protein